jgi:hypothetical protein
MTTASPRKPSPRKPEAPPPPLVDPALERQWERQLARVQAATARDARAFDEKYEAIAAIIEHEPPLYLAGGCKTFGEFVRKYIHEDEKLVRMWVDVATHATPEEEAKYTPTRLAALLSYLRATHEGGAVPDTIRWDRLKVPVRTGRTTKQIPALEASVREIRAATSDALRGRGARPRGEPEAQARAKAALREAGLEEVVIAWRDGEYSFRAVPGYALREFARALMKIDEAAREHAVKESARAAKPRGREPGRVAGQRAKR